jgi:hypothetical protein
MLGVKTNPYIGCLIISYNVFMQKNKFKIKKYDGITNEELFIELQDRGFYVQKIGLDNGDAPQDIDYLVVTCSPPKNLHSIALSKSN